MTTKWIKIICPHCKKEFAIMVEIHGISYKSDEYKIKKEDLERSGECLIH